jgi:flavin reductase (DIM6/NTAB) family NADH-FMN oxidoreductase RutF
VYAKVYRGFESLPLRSLFISSTASAVRLADPSPSGSRGLRLQSAVTLQIYPHPPPMPTFSHKSIDPLTLNARECYQHLVSLIIPRPIALVTTINNQGQTNLAPFSFFNGVSSAPPTISISIAYNSDGTKKDTLRNIEETGEFVVNAGSEWLADAIAESGAQYKYGDSEIVRANLTPIASELVKAPRLQEAAWHLECRLYKSVLIGQEYTPGATTLIIGEILRLHIADELYSNGKLDATKAKPLARLGGVAYTELGRVFDMPINSPKP